MVHWNVEKFLEVTTLQSESDEMSESGEMLDGELSEELPQCSAEEKPRSVEVEPEEETRAPLSNVDGDPSSDAEKRESSQEPDCSIRRSQRKKEKPERLQYRELGNPLALVAQALFHGLNTAFTNSLNGVDFLKHPYPQPSTYQSQASQ